MPKRHDKTIDYEIKPTDRVRDFLDVDADWPLEPSNVLMKFKEKIHSIYKVGEERGICPGELLLMININFGYFKRDMPWGRMDEVREWVINNAFRNYQILEPENHKILMQSDNEYSRNFKKLDRPGRTEW